MAVGPGRGILRSSQRGSINTRPRWQYSYLSKVAVIIPVQGGRIDTWTGKIPLSGPWLAPKVWHAGPRHVAHRFQIRSNGGIQGEFVQTTKATQRNLDGAKALHKH